ncbi:DUF4388 domain-containing protein [Deinococcus sp. Marseille-Q6407]|uniref:DUF4388 domain-containing protein n=1 Tax=Deinococcus sp. Marseille-Q6407 TaxID=2969223 RepID=UPI0021C191F7|nr:DUF4388 domain-containing protein [Deinococcus sp. Marseille-Q6407]
MLVLNHSFQASGGAAGIRGTLAELPLNSLLELIHAAQQTGLLEVEAFLGRSSLTLRLAFFGGEIVDCAVLDWPGLDALFSFPQDLSAGHAEFWAIDPAQVQAQPPLAPFEFILSEWARVTDEWPRYNEWIGSPSTRFIGAMAPFSRPGGCSVRAAAHAGARPLHEVASQVAELAQAGLLRPKNEPPHQEWQFLPLPAPHTFIAAQAGSPLEDLNGQLSLFDVQQARSIPIGLVRAELMRAIQRGYRFPGCGWVMRDLIWEQDWEEADLMVL